MVKYSRSFSHAVTVFPSLDEWTDEYTEAIELSMNSLSASISAGVTRRYGETVVSVVLSTIS